MELSEEHKKITRLIARKIVVGLSEQDEQFLSNWRNKSEQNEIIYQRLVDVEYLGKNVRRLERVDVHQYRKAAERVLFPYRIRQIRYIRYAAAVAVLIVGSALVGYLLPDQKNEATFVAQKEVIEPGSQKATLVLADGQSVDLGAAKDKQINIKGIEISGEQAVVKRNTEGKAAEWNKLIIPRGGEYKLVLGDGTVVYINSESCLEFPVKFTGKNREVRLHGEAYFKVTKSQEHPFIVKTDKMDILVTGTEFNVKAYQNEKLVQATLVSGQVRVAVGEDRSQTQVLIPSQQAEFGQDGQLQVKNVDVNSFIAWKNGQFIFKNDRLEDIMTVLARWYDFEVFYLNDSVRDLVFAGKLNRLEAIDPILEIMASTGKINIEIKGKSVVLSAK